MGIFQKKPPADPPHPRKEPRLEGPLTPERLGEVFADCVDFNCRSVTVGGNEAMRCQLLFIAGMVRMERVSDYVLRPLAQDRELLTNLPAEPPRSVYAIHRNDILYKTQEPALKELVKPLTEGLAYDHEPLQYLLVDGEFCGAVVGHFRNGPYDLNDVVCSLPDARERREELLDAVRAVNFGKGPQRFLGEAL